MESPDIEGRNCFWYLQRFDLFKILDCKIMDKFITEKWNGRVNLNCTLLDYSTSVVLLKDNHSIYLTNQVMQNLFAQIFNKDRSAQTHHTKFHVWRRSMACRYYIESAFTLFLTLFF